MSSTSSAEPGNRWRKAAFVGTLVVLLIGVFPYFGRFMNANERPRLLQAMAWIEEGSSAIDGPAARDIDPGIDVSRAPVAQGGRLYPNKPPGTTVPAAVAYAALRGVEAVGGPAPTLRSFTWLARLLGGGLPTLLVLGVAARRFGGRPKAMIFALVVYALATPASSYARLLYGHQLAAACSFIGILWIADALPARRRWLAFAGGLVASCAVTVEYLAAFAALPIAVYLVLSVRRGHGLAPAGFAVLGALIPAGLLAAYHALVFGSIWTTPYHFVVREEFAAIHGQGLLGLTWPSMTSVYEHLLSPWGGLLYWAPLVVPAGVASARAIRRREHEPFESLALAVFGVLLVLNLCLAQTGGWRVGPRYLVLALPLLIPGWIRVHHWASTSGVRWGVSVALLGWSMLANFFASTLFPHLVPSGNPLADLLLPLWIEGLRPYTWGSPIGWGGIGLEVLGVGTLALFAVVTQPAADDPRARRRWGAAVAGAFGLLIVALQLPGSAQGADTFEAVRRIWEPGGPGEPTTERLGPTRS